MSGVIKNTAYRAQIVAFLIANLVVCWVVNVGVDALAADWKDVTTYAAKGLWPSVGLIAASALNGVIDDVGKARIVFLRWANPLPGAEAFSQIITTDSRIDVKRLTTKHGPFPAEPAAQNSLWYKLYKTVADRPEVRHVHRDYLLNRDLAVLALLLTVAAPIVSAFFSAKAAAILFAIFGAEFFVLRRAAAVYGRRFVTTVLAVKSAQR